MSSEEGLGLRKLWAYFFCCGVTAISWLGKGSKEIVMLTCLGGFGLLGHVGVRVLMSTTRRIYITREQFNGLPLHHLWREEILRRRASEGILNCQQ